MSRFYFYMFSAIVLFGAIGVALLKQIGLIDYSFFITTPPPDGLYAAATLYWIMFTVGLFAFRRMLGLNVTAPGSSEVALALNGQTTLLVTAFACFVALIYLWLDSDLLSAETAFRHSGNELVRRICLIVFLSGIFVVSAQPTLVRLLPLALLLFAATLFPAADAGRSVSLPFIVSGATMIYNRYRIGGVILLVVGAVALAAAFETREAASYFYFWSTFFDIVAHVDVLRVIRPIVQFSFPGLDTLAIMTGHAEYLNVNAFYRLLEFLAYYSPLPSFLFSEGFFEQTSLNNILGIPLETIGINSDIYSEALFWFGYPGMIVIPLLLALMTCLSFWSARALLPRTPQRAQLIAALPVVWMLVGGMVFSLRAGSRFVWIIIAAALVLVLARHFRRRVDAGPGAGAVR